jgi:hypothetical protein
MSETNERTLEQTTWFAILWFFVRVYLVLLAFIAPLMSILYLAHRLGGELNIDSRWHGLGPMTDGQQFAVVLAQWIPAALGWHWMLRGNKRSQRNLSLKSAYVILVLLFLTICLLVDINLTEDRIKDLEIQRITVEKVVDAETGQVLTDAHFSTSDEAGARRLPYVLDTSPGAVELTWVAVGRTPPITVTVSREGYRSQTIDAVGDRIVKLEPIADRTPADE